MRTGDWAEGASFHCPARIPSAPLAIRKARSARPVDSRRSSYATRGHPQVNVGAQTLPDGTRGDVQAFRDVPT